MFRNAKILRENNLVWWKFHTATKQFRVLPIKYPLEKISQYEISPKSIRKILYYQIQYKKSVVIFFKSLFLR
jgi:hypothetical protein